NLLALEADPTYQMLAPRASSPLTMEGETLRVVEPALRAMREIFEQRAQLTEVLERAREVRASMSGVAFWGNDEKEKRIHELLEGPSIELEQRATPLARRELLGPGAQEVHVVPEQLLAAMASAFEGARDAVVAVQRAWESAEPALAKVAKWIEDVRATSVALGLEASTRDELGGMDRELEALRVRLARDPLGTSASVGATLGPRLAALASRLDEVAELRRRVTERLASAKSLLARVREVRQRASDAVDAMPREVEGATVSGAPTDAGLVEGLAPWLQKIESAAVAGRWPTADVGLRKWEEAAGAYLANDSGIAGAFERVMARREELSGRLSARRAQVAALVSRGQVVPPGADEAAREAERLLAARPTPLARVTALVDRFETLVGR
ncbi:MAG TPA: hypothetical protein VIF09_25755, partial [Polyangiaceae bacterium]